MLGVLSMCLIDGVLVCVCVRVCFVCVCVRVFVFMRALFVRWCVHVLVCLF